MGKIEQLWDCIFEHIEMNTLTTFLKLTTIALIIFSCFGKQLQAQPPSGFWGSKQMGIQLNLARWHDVFFESYPILDEIGIQAQLRWELNPRLDLISGMGVDQGYIRKTNLFVEEIPGPTPGTTVSIASYDQRKAKAFNFDLPVLLDYELLLKENWSLSLQAGVIFIHKKVNSESIFIDAEFLKPFQMNKLHSLKKLSLPMDELALT